MRSYIIAFGLLVAGVTAVSAQGYGTGSNPNDHYVGGYETGRGTYVEPHYQTNPNGSTNDNYETRGNYNPHTGAMARARRTDRVGPLDRLAAVFLTRLDDLADWQIGVTGNASSGVQALHHARRCVLAPISLQ